MEKFHCGLNLGARRLFAVAVATAMSALFCLWIPRAAWGSSGCADGQREGFVNVGLFPNIAGCGGGWTIPGVSLFAPASAPSCPTLMPANTRSPACGRNAGDDSENPTGNGCNVADLCASGWHVCLDANDVSNASGGTCNGATQAGDSPLLFLSRQSSTGCSVCATGTSTASTCNSSTCASGCLQTEHISNDVFGCGNYGTTVNPVCAPLDRYSGNFCSAISAQGWSCSSGVTGASLCETFTIVHSNPATGGVLCCVDGSSSDSDQDGVLDEVDNCISVPNPLQEDRDEDGIGDECDPDSPSSPTPTATISPSPTASPVPGVTCGPAPQIACRTQSKANRGRLSIDDWSGKFDKKDRVEWVWRRGVSTTLADFGDGAAGDSYAVCLYDGIGVLRFAASIGGGKAWRKGRSFVAFSDRKLTTMGVRMLRLRSTGAAAGRAAIRFVAGGKLGNLGNAGPGNLPNLGGLPIPVATGGVRMQLVSSNGNCWESHFENRIRRNQVINSRVSRLRAKND